MSDGLEEEKSALSPSLRVPFWLAAGVCGILWLGLLALFLACAKYPPYSSDVVVEEIPGAYDQFLENRRIAHQLKGAMESGVLQVGLAIAGVWAIGVGWSSGRSLKNRVFIVQGVVVAGCITVFLGLVVLPLIIARGTSACNACINVLRQIDGCKEQWALEHKKTLTDTPAWKDLVGHDKYLKVMPECPGGGRFSLKNMATKPACSISDHTLQ